MTNVLIYWRDYRQNWVRQFAGEHALYWHSQARLFEGLAPGDRLWLVTAGKNVGPVGREAPQAGFLVGVWQVWEVLANPGDDPAYSREDYRFRVVADGSASILFEESVFVDHIVRPEGRDRAVSIGRFLQGPRKLKDEKVRQLRSAAGPLLAKYYLAGRQAT